MRIAPDGTMQPWATGMRSPAGLGFIGDELFYTENQGDWIGSGGLWHLRKGDFTGNPAGLKWAHLPESPVNLPYKDRKSVVSGKSVSVRVDLVGRRIFTQQHQQQNNL